MNSIPDTNINSQINAIKSTIGHFVDGADTRNADMVDAALSPEFRIVFSTQGTNGISVMDRETFMNLLRSGKLGGTPRKVESLNVVVKGILAKATVLIGGVTSRFETDFDLVFLGNEWQIIHEMTHFTPRR